MSFPATFGQLQCRLVDAIPQNQQPELVVVLCHGFGAPGTDLVPIGTQLLALRPGLADRVRFVFPAAPLTLDEMGMPEGRAWWPVDVERFSVALETGQLEALRKECPPGMAEARALLTELIQEVCRQYQLPASRIVLGGFSQGAMLATDVALRMTDSPACLCIWSGTLLCEDQWRELAIRHASLDVLQSHGQVDPLLPFQSALWLRDMLQECGLDVEFLEFSGDHTIPPEGIFKLLHRIQVLADTGSASE